MNKVDQLDYNLNFLKGIFFLWNVNYRKASNYFAAAVDETDPIEPVYVLYLSYRGLSEVLDHKKSGLHYCYQSSHISPNEVELWLNLSFSEFISGNRKRGIHAVQKISDINVSGRNARIIESYINIIGKRQKNSAGTMKRSSLLNISMGKMFRKDNDLNSERLEKFIREMVKLRYKGIIQLHYQEMFKLLYKSA